MHEADAGRRLTSLARIQRRRSMTQPGRAGARDRAAVRGPVPASRGEVEGAAGAGGREGRGGGGRAGPGIAGGGGGDIADAGPGCGAGGGFEGLIGSCLLAGSTRRGLAVRAGGSKRESGAILLVLAG